MSLSFSRLIHILQKAWWFQNDACLWQIRPSEWPLWQIRLEKNPRILQYDEKNFSLIPENFEDGNLKVLENELYLVTLDSFLDSHQFLQWRIMNFWSEMQPLETFWEYRLLPSQLNPTTESEKQSVWEIDSWSLYSFSLQDLLKGFIQVLLHFHSLDYPLKW